MTAVAPRRDCQPDDCHEISLRLPSLPIHFAPSGAPMPTRTLPTQHDLRRVSRFAPALACVALLSACATNPATGRRELSLVSTSQEIAMGQEGAKAAAAQMGIYPDSGLQRYVAGLGMPLAKSSERPDLPWSFTVVDDAMVNAFALPGGPIFVSRGILALHEFRGAAGLGARA